MLREKFSSTVVKLNANWKLMLFAEYWRNL